MTKVTLINPAKMIIGEDGLSSVTDSETLSLLYIASYLEKHGVEVNVIDEVVGDDALKMVAARKPDFVGITAVTRLASRAYEIADHCRGLGIPTVIGGVHASVLPEEALTHCDIVVKGEGEQAMLDIVNGKVKSGIYDGPLTPHLDDIPPPARHLINAEFYLSSRDRLPMGKFFFAPPGSKSATIITQRGCPFSCVFCYNSLKDAPVRYHSAERVVAEIEDLYTRYGVTALNFVDDELFVNKKRFAKICELLAQKEFKIMFACTTRASSVTKEILDEAKKAGCVFVGYGLESGSQRILDVLGKRLTLEQSRKAVRLAKEAGLMVGAAFMIGNPTETMEDIAMTRRFITELDMTSAIVLVSTPFPGTQLRQYCEERSLIDPKMTWDDYDLEKCVAQMSEITAPELERIVAEIGKELSKDVPIELGGFLKRKLRHPLKTLKKIFTQYKNIPHVLRRLRI